jgi:hypothetical protein
MKNNKIINKKIIFVLVAMFCIGTCSNFTAATLKPQHILSEKISQIQAPAPGIPFPPAGYSYSLLLTEKWVRVQIGMPMHAFGITTNLYTLNQTDENGDLPFKSFEHNNYTGINTLNYDAFMHNGKFASNNLTIWLPNGFEYNQELTEQYFNIMHPGHEGEWWWHQWLGVSTSVYVFTLMSFPRPIRVITQVIYPNAPYILETVGSVSENGILTITGYNNILSMEYC